ncbi:hypothetical protein [Streptomyces sp. NPDC006267]|uniref:hypothetical protein n=1 Tax=unclassified Streptomyces TaxID=2593676 RepID=UPI00339DAEDB
MATGTGLWDAGLDAWYGPGTPLVRRVRSYRPNRRGHVKLVRWLRVGLTRAAALLMVVLALGATLDPASALDSVERGLAGAAALAAAAFVWRCSLIRVVLRPGGIVRHGLWRHAVVSCSSVKRFYRPGDRSPLVLETHAGEEVAFWWFDGSLWDLFYDFSRVCADAMHAHVRPARSSPARSRGASSRSAAVERRYTWSAGADPMALGAVVCAVAGLTG